MLLEYVGLRKLLQMIHAVGAYAPGVAGSGAAAPGRSIISGQNLTEADE